MSDLITDFPALLNYWDFDKNIKIDVEKITITSKKHINWKCPTCSYEWKASTSKSYKNIQNHSKICPVCELGKVFIKGENSISARIPNFLRYINFHYENIETIQEEIDNLSFSSKRLFHFKCPTCHVGWKDVANTSKLINKHNQELVHVGCNESTHFVPYTKAYPNLRKIYLPGEQNDVEFNDLKLNDNVTIPRNWKCDKCDHIFKLSIDQLISRIKRYSFYCTNCKATFDTSIKVKANPLLHTDRNLFKQFIPTHVKSNMIDSLSNILVRWQCFKCHGQYECSVVKRHFEGCPYCDNKLMLKGYNTLQETHPYLEKFWDKSNDKPISEYWYKSSKCINWKCPCCKVSFYCSPIEMISRTDLENSNFQTCPNRCDWDTLVFNNDILYNFPKLQEEWSDKNGLPVHLALSHIETKKYWWKCSVCQGEYLCSIPIRREVPNACPYCNNEQALKGYNTISDIYPELCDYWSSKNLLKPDEVTSVESENKIFTWICDCCELEFDEKLGIVLDAFTNSNFNRFNSICPYCNKKIPKPNEKLSFAKPYLINEWVKELNGDIDTFFYDSNILVDWICRKCHRSFKAKISERCENDRCCPYCSFKKTGKGYNDLETTHPWLIKEWSTLNKQEMSSVRANSTCTAWWKCPVCTGEYQQVIIEKFYRDNSCPYCRNQKVLKGFNDLATTHSWLIKEWSILNDRDFSSLTCNSNYRAWWKCSECRREYRQTVKKKILMNISCCTYCQNNKVLKGFNDLATTHEYLLNEWDYLNNILLAKPTEIDEKSNKIVWWICKDDPNHRYKFKINEKIKYEKRNLITCKICKGLRRKQEHFVQFVN